MRPFVSAGVTSVPRHQGDRPTLKYTLIPSGAEDGYKNLFTGSWDSTTQQAAVGNFTDFYEGAVGIAVKVPLAQGATVRKADLAFYTTASLAGSPTVQVDTPQTTDFTYSASYLPTATTPIGSVSRPVPANPSAAVFVDFDITAAINAMLAHANWAANKYCRLAVRFLVEDNVLYNIHLSESTIEPPPKLRLWQ